MHDDLMQTTKRTDPNVRTCGVCQRPIQQHRMCCSPLERGAIVIWPPGWKLEQLMPGGETKPLTQE